MQKTNGEIIKMRKDQAVWSIVASQKAFTTEQWFSLRLANKQAPFTVLQPPFLLKEHIDYAKNFTICTSNTVFSVIALEIAFIY